MELLVVITLVAILAGMVIAAMPGILQGIKRKQVATFMAELEAGLEDYNIDHGLYPLNPKNGSGGGNLPGDEVAVEGAVVLYRHLSGDYDMDQEGIVDDDTKVYVDRLNNWSNRADSGGRKPPVERSVPFGEGYAVVDPLGGPVRYLAYPPGLPPDQKPTRNPTYDIWSLGGASSDSPDFSDEAKWITNWGNGN